MASCPGAPARPPRPDPRSVQIRRESLASASTSASGAESEPLCEREREVLRLLARGHTDQEISKQLFISARTAATPGRI
jgi:DNA-binding NarL/FixJ family response regulator